MPHIKLRFSSQSGHPDLLYSQEWVNVIFLHLWPKKLYRAFRFGTLWPISCSYRRHSQLTRHSLMLANGRIRQSLTALVCITGPLWGESTGHWWWGGWGCEVSCGGHHQLRGKTTTGSAPDGAVFGITQILAYLVHNMSRSQLYLGFRHFGWLPSFFGQ